MISFREKYAPRVQPDWRSFRAVALECDDWGACEYAPSQEAWRQTVAETPPETLRPSQSGKLESSGDIERLGAVLEKHPGKDGLPLTVTAFFCLANPDYEKITATRQYRDIPIDQGFPHGWEEDSLPKAWSEAAGKGWFAPEFHTRFHHMNAADWLKLLREDSQAGAEARKRFDRSIYYQNTHYPEYAGLTPEQTQQWLAPALATFRRLFSKTPTAGVTSDATPLTEIIWAANGIKTFCLRNFSIPGAQPLVYHTKPWNNQDISTPMGAWNPETDVVYLSRNVFFEPGFDPEYSFEKIIADIEAVWQRNEPAVLSSHRLNYAAWDERITGRGLAELERLLARLAKRGNVNFLTTAEVAAIYREGRSTRKAWGREIIHQPPML